MGENVNQVNKNSLSPSSSKRNNARTPVDLKKKSGWAINLIPPMSRGEQQKFEKKENINLSSAVLIFFIMLFTVGVLLGNFYSRTSKAQADSQLDEIEKTLDTLEEKELLLKNTVVKYENIVSLKSKELQYYYFTSEVDGFPTNIKVKTLSLGANEEFELAGLAVSEDDFDSFVTLLESDEDFSDVNIVLMKVLSPQEIKKAQELNEEGYSVQWRLGGVFSKEESET